MNHLLDTRHRVRTALRAAARALPVVAAGISPLAPPAPAAPPAAPPAEAARADEGRLATAAELRQMRDAGQYRICLQQIGRALRSGNADQAYDRYDLLLLRGDCLLHLEDPETALTAYEAAARSPEPAQAREGRATALLLRRITRMAYVPRGGDAGDAGDAGDGISVAGKASRIKALRALLRDELRADDAELRRAMSAPDLVPIHDVLPKLADLYAVERTATGGDAQMRPTLEAIGRRARILIDQELGIREQQIAAVSDRANQRVDYAAGGLWWGGTARRGLYTSDRRELRDLMAYLRRVDETARLGQQLAVAFDGDAIVWDPLIYRASRAVRRAQDVLDAE